MAKMVRDLLLLGTLATSAWCSGGTSPIAFEANRGQAPAEFGYLSRGHGYAVSLGATRVEWVARDSRVTAWIEGARATASSEPAAKLPGVVNYLRGGSRADWVLDVPTYERVRYQRIYPGIDVTYYGKEGRLEYDFMVGPGANPDRISLRYEGATSIHLSAK